MPINLLCIASYCKGQRFMEQAAQLGARVYLLTQEKFLKADWPRDSLADVFAQPNEAPLQQTINTVSWLARTIKLDAIVPLDDYDLETAAALREHMRLPGLGDTATRFFRDKLATRVRAAAVGLPVPEFVHVLHHDTIAQFMARVPPPWMLKPRSEASAAGIKKIHAPADLFRTIEEYGDRQSYYLLERFLPGDVHHVDAITVGGEVIFAAAHKCAMPPFDVAHGGGIFRTETVPRDSDDERALIDLNRRVLKELGLQRGASHTEFIKARADGKFYLLETAARVGGAHIAEVVEASSGVNLWAEWAKLEIGALDGSLNKYTLPPQRSDHAGIAISLARQEHPDTSQFSDPEIVYRVPDKHHIGLVVRSPDPARVSALLDDYCIRYHRDYFASLPAGARPEH
jgi:biotin carboxylase